MATTDAQIPCCLGDIIEGQNLGKEVNVTDTLKAYITKASPIQDRKIGIFVFSDIFGWQLPNTRRVVDFLAGNGYTTIMPDFFGNDVWVEGNDWSKFGGWLANHATETKFSQVEACINYLKEKEGLSKFGTIGFCWGGAAVQNSLANLDFFSAGVAFYGIQTQKDNLKNVFQPKGPVLFIFGGADPMIPQERVDALAEKLKENSKQVFEVKVFPNQPHGFAHRKKAASKGDDDDKAQTQALDDLISWLSKHL